LPVRRHCEILPVAGGVEDQRPARRRVDRWWSAAHAGAVVSAYRRHHDIVGLGGGGPADAERRDAAGSATAGDRGVAEPDDRRYGTGLRHVALVHRRAAHGARVAGRMLTGAVRAVAGIGGAGVAVVRARRARIAHRVLARVAAAVALVEGAGVTVVRAGRPGGPLRVGWAGGARPGAVLGHVTHARRGPADGGRGQEAVGGTGGTRPGAVLRHVAHARRGAADGAGGQGAVRGTGGAGPGGRHRHVAGAGGGAAHGARPH